VYVTPGTYTVSISGDQLTHFGNPAGYPGADTLTSVSSWGNVGITNLSGAFEGATHLTSVPALLPPGTTNLSYTFDGATVFNGDITGWKTSTVTTMRATFRGDTAFNQPIGGWDTSAVTSMREMFSGASAFNQPLAGWNTSSVRDLTSTFAGDVAFNQPLGTWDTSRVFSMTSMFAGDPLFNQSLAGWNTSNVGSMDAMFSSATSFNQPLAGWDTSSVSTFDHMFDHAGAFNQPLAPWNTSSAGSMTAMFSGATSFNQPLGTWDTSGVQSTRAMFSGATAFNQPLATWRTASVTDMSAMFSGATSFNQPHGAWDTSSVLDLTGFLVGATAFSYANYDNLLNGWAQNLNQPGVTLDAPGLYYLSVAANAHQVLTAAPPGWTINDAGLGVPPGIAAVSVTGTPTVGQTLTAVPTGVTGAPAPTLTYQWQRSADGTTGWTPVVGATAVTYQVPSSAGLAYLRVVVTAANPIGPNAVTASPATSQVAPIAPTAPRNAVATPLNRAAVVAWVAPVDNGGAPITGYLVSAVPAVGTVTRTCHTTGALTCIVTGLVNKTVYTFPVTATNQAGTGVPSAASAPITVGVPTAPRALSVAFPAARTVTVSWLAPSSLGSGPVTAFLVRWSADGGLTWSAATATKLTHLTRVGSLKGHRYLVQVAARNASGTSASAILAFTQRR
jgi:surface protein